MLLDENLPVEFRHELTGHDVATARFAGLTDISDGVLLDGVVGRFDVLVTGDKSMQFQQNLDGRPVAIVLLRCGTRMADLLQIVPELLAVLEQIRAGEVHIVHGKATYALLAHPGAPTLSANRLHVPAGPTLTIAPTVVDAIGNTPLIKLKRASAETGCTILGKAEFMNPGQSVKDRAALFIIRDAERSGRLKPGGIIVEGTAGNTGIGLAMVGNALGYHSVIVIPDTQSQEKKDTLRMLGARLVEVPAVPYANPNNYVKYSGRLAEALAGSTPAGAVWANQFDNVANRRGHAETTAREIWDQTDGKVDGFVSAVGTGGTLAGVAEGLKARNSKVRVALADPHGAAIYDWFKTGKLRAEGSSITEGIGQGRITANLEGLRIDEAYRIPDAEALEIIFRLVTEEGLSLGGSSGINIAGAICLAKQMGPGHTIVTILCDLGNRYQSKLYNPAFLRSKGLPVPKFLESLGDALPVVYERVG